jgi:hypothetical protein
MIILDTNVVSETMRPRPAAAVIDWLDRQPPNELYLTSVSVGEIYFGLECLDDGRRKLDLQARFAEFLERGFHGRVLDYSMECARSYGELMARRRALGRPLSAPEGQIAAVCRFHGAELATRNVADVETTGLSIINPFQH